MGRGIKFEILFILIFSLHGLLGSVTRHIQLQDYAVLHQPIYRRRCGLPPVDMDKLKASDASLQQLKDNITSNLGDQGWLMEKVRSLEYDDGFSFKELIEKA